MESGKLKCNNIIIKYHIGIRIYWESNPALWVLYPSLVIYIINALQEIETPIGHNGFAALYAATWTIYTIIRLDIPV